METTPNPQRPLTQDELLKAILTLVPPLFRGPKNPSAEGIAFFQESFTGFMRHRARAFDVYGAKEHYQAMFAAVKEMLPPSSDGASLAQADPNTPPLAVVVEGGCVSAVLSADGRLQGMPVLLLDYDSPEEDMPSDRFVDVVDSSGSTFRAESFVVGVEKPGVSVPQFGFGCPPLAGPQASNAGPEAKPADEPTVEPVAEPSAPAPSKRPRMKP